MSVCVCVCATPCKNNKSTSLPLILFYLIISPSALPLCLHPPAPPSPTTTFTSLCSACTHLFSHSPTLSPHTPGTPTPPLLLFQARHSRLLKMSSVEQRLCCKQRGRGWRRQLRWDAGEQKNNKGSHKGNKNSKGRVEIEINPPCLH